MGCLRFFLAYIVLASHCPQPQTLINFLHPALAVQCFYVISGFYIQLIIAENEIISRDKIVSFYKSRIARIFPTYYLISIASITLIGAPWFFEHLKNHDWTALFIGIFTNIFLVGKDIVKMYYPYQTMETVQASWTLSIELIFYLLAPWILKLRFRNIFLIAAFLATARVVCLQWSIDNPEIFHKIFPQDLWQINFLYGFLPFEISLFLAGSLGCRIYIKYIKNNNSKLLYYFSGATLVWLFWFMDRGWNKIDGGSWTEGIFLVPDKYWAVLIALIITIPTIFHFTRNIKWDRKIGELSYPLYLSHFTIIYFIQGHSLVAKEYIGITTLISSLIISMIILLIVEIPMDHWRHKKFNYQKKSD